MIVAVDQHAEQTGDRSLTGTAGPRAFEQARKFGENGGRIALGRRGLAIGEADLALRHGEAGDRIHQAHHVAARITEVLGDGERGPGRLATHERG